MTIVYNVKCSCWDNMVKYLDFTIPLREVNEIGRYNAAPKAPPILTIRRILSWLNTALIKLIRIFNSYRFRKFQYSYK